jgi:serine/threonine-protein kinase RsbW
VVSARIILGKDKQDLHRLAELVGAFGRNADLDDEELFAIDLSLHEWVANIQSHGFQVSRKESRISVTLTGTPSEVRVEVEDTGIPFNPLQYPSPDTSLKLEEKPIGGLGIFIVRKYMDDVAYDRLDDRNRLVMIKRRRN